MRVLTLLFAFILPTHVFTFGAPLFMAVAAREGGANNHILIENDYIRVYDWLKEHGERDQVVLASPFPGLWIPARTELRVIYGHPYETVPAAERLQQIQDFYWGLDCETLFGDSMPFEVNYALWGPKEDDAGYVDLDDEEAARLNLDDFVDQNSELVEDDRVRVPTADECHRYLDEHADQTLNFGTVTLYIFDHDTP